MANTKAIIDEIIDAETPDDNPATPQDERAIVTNRPSDRGGRTQFGISEKHNPQAWLDGKVTEAEARAIYERKYVAPLKGLESHPAFAQLIDWGVTSGPRLVIQKLQEIVGAEVDGVLGPETLAKVSQVDGKELNNKLVVAHVLMIGRLIHRDRRQVENINGWLSRAVKWLL